MVPVLVYIILSTLTISLCAFAGAITLFFNHKSVEKVIMALVSLSAGALIGGAFLHLLPEALEGIEVETALMIVIGGFIFFFVVEKIFEWRHCHKEECKIHSFGYMNLFGDSIHNFIDGVVIASSFLVDIKVGIMTTIAIAMHEIPQEIGDYGVLLHSGFHRMKALFMNFGVALTVVVGAVAGYMLKDIIGSNIPYVLPFAAGGFIYIASSDLIPELRKEKIMKKWLLNFGVFLGGLLIMYFARFLE